MDSENINRTFYMTMLKAAVRLVLLTLIMFAILFLAAGHLDWWEGWVYVGQGLFILLFSRAILIAKNPDTAMERSEAGKKENVMPWDKVLMPLTAIYLPFLSWIVAGLDERFGWTPNNAIGIKLIALAVLIAGNVLGTWAMLENRFFSSFVRIQTDRGHTVVNTGPYRIVRHPAYTGSVLSWLAAPFYFSSYWVAVPAVLAIAAGVMRTYKEDQVLQKELPGYLEYAKKVRYRLIPGIW